jgi:hypothetical protein
MQHESERQRYRPGAHTVTELKYHFVWKTQSSPDSAIQLCLPPILPVSDSASP